MKNNGVRPLKVFARSIFPSAYDRIQGWYWHRKYDPVYATVDRICGDTVKSGPFGGLRYLREATGSAVLPKRLGTYEAELHPLLEKLAAPYECCIDIGCAEGYYAVGLAVKLRIPVYAYDIEPAATRLCSQLAALNSVQHLVHLRQACTPDDLAALKQRRALVIADCEGFERTLFTAAATAGLDRADILVETHDFLIGDASQTVIAALSPTHDIARINVLPRSGMNFPLSAQFSPTHWSLAVEEGRPSDQFWIWATPRPSSPVPTP